MDTYRKTMWLGIKSSSCKKCVTSNADACGGTSSTIEEPCDLARSHYSNQACIQEW